MTQSLALFPGAAGPPVLKAPHPLIITLDIRLP